METFKIIPKYENYSISNLGKIKNNKTNKILKTWFGGGKTRDYEYCRIINDDGHKKITIHILVALCFISERPLNLEIDHIDRNSKNNNVNNLRYVSKSENLFNKNYQLKPQKNNQLKEHHIHKNIYKNTIKYYVQIKGKYLGLFKILENAINVRDKYILNNPL